MWYAYLHIGGSDMNNPITAVGDTYCGIIKLLVGSYIDPEVSVSSSTGNTWMSGALHVTGGFSASNGTSGNAIIIAVDTGSVTILQIGNTIRTIGLCRGSGYAASQCYISSSSSKVMTVCGFNGAHLPYSATSWTSASEETLRYSWNLRNAIRRYKAKQRYEIQGVERYG